MIPIWRGFVSWSSSTISRSSAPRRRGDLRVLVQQPGRRGSRSSKSAPPRVCLSRLSAGRTLPAARPRAGSQPRRGHPLAPWRGRRVRRRRRRPRRIERVAAARQLQLGDRHESGRPEPRTSSQRSRRSSAACTVAVTVACERARWSSVQALARRADAALTGRGGGSGSRGVSTPRLRRSSKTANSARRSSSTPNVAARSSASGRRCQLARACRGLLAQARRLGVVEHDEFRRDRREQGVGAQEPSAVTHGRLRSAQQRSRVRPCADRRRAAPGARGSRNSPAARSVNVIARIRLGGTPSSQTARTKRSTSTLVLPLPAFAASASEPCRLATRPAARHSATASPVGRGRRASAARPRSRRTDTADRGVATAIAPAARKGRGAISPRSISAAIATAAASRSSRTAALAGRSSLSGAASGSASAMSSRISPRARSSARNGW